MEQFLQFGVNFDSPENLMWMFPHEVMMENNMKKSTKSGPTQLEFLRLLPAKSHIIFTWRVFNDLNRNQTKRSARPAACSKSVPSGRRTAKISSLFPPQRSKNNHSSPARSRAARF